MSMLLALLMCPVAADVLGGWTPYSAEELHHGARVHNLAKFAVNALSRSSNALDLQRAAFVGVSRAEHQVSRRCRLPDPASLAMVKSNRFPPYCLISPPWCAM